ncbi:MAG TPA: M15 family metallopeptidase [Thermoanaerobaculia bacterium]
MKTGFRFLSFSLLVSLATWPLAAQDGPPKEDRAFRESDLVELVTLDATIRLDVRYAGKNNEFGRPFYSEARAFLQRPAAEALVRVNRALKAKGYGLLVFDGYRPWAVTRQFWDLTPADKKVFVANPKNGSRHNRGGAVDLTLYDLATGHEADMGGRYDEMTARSHVTYEKGPKDALLRRELLIDAMGDEGFFVYAFEWWHFDWKDFREYPILDVPFAALKQLSPAAATR